MIPDTNQPLDLAAKLAEYTSHVHAPGPLCERAKHSDYPCTCGLDGLLAALRSPRPSPADLREELSKVIDLCTVEGYIPADEDGPNRIGYMVGKIDDGKSALYTNPERAFSKTFPNLAALLAAPVSPAEGGAAK